MREVRFFDQVKLDRRARPIVEKLAQSEHEREPERKGKRCPREPRERRAEHSHQLGRGQRERGVDECGDQKDDPDETRGSPAGLTPRSGIAMRVAHGEGRPSRSCPSLAMARMASNKGCTVKMDV